MAFQFSTAVRNAWLDAIEAAIGTSVTLEIRTGAAPADCAAADSGTVLAIIALPADWMAAAAAGAKAMQGTWQDASADASGTAGHFRIKVGGTCHIQGSCSGTGGGGDMIIDNPVLAAGQQFNVTSFSLTASGA
jgi:hypothetical protein